MREIGADDEVDENAPSHLPTFSDGRQRPA
jgi:hypothetical protein